jgi:hypothetical protein
VNVRKTLRVWTTIQSGGADWVTAGQLRIASGVAKTLELQAVTTGRDQLHCQQDLPRKIDFV